MLGEDASARPTRLGLVNRFTFSDRTRQVAPSSRFPTQPACASCPARAPASGLPPRLGSVRRAPRLHGCCRTQRSDIQRTPGMVLAAIDLLKRNPQPTEDDIRNGLAGNLCRCTGYMKIFESVVRAYQK